MPKAATPASIRSHVLAVRSSVSALDRSLVQLAASLDGTSPARPAKSRPAKKLSPRARAALKLQGRYMGYMRQSEERMTGDG